MTTSINVKKHVIEGASQGPHLLITGGVHGDEFEPMAAVRRLIAEISPSKLRGKLTLIPVVNEPAFERGRRTAEDELDLARTFPGRRDGSVTEQIAWEMTQIIRSSEFFIDLHTGGTTLSILPLAGYFLHPIQTIRDRQREMAQAFNLPIVWGTTASLEGRTLSVARDANVPAIYAEYLGGGTYSAEGVVALVDGCLNVMAMFGLIDRQAPQKCVEMIVEDPRAESGHLQRNFPSPRAGFFQPSVKLGQAITTGTLIGTVCNALGDDTTPIYSNQTGIVLLLRTFPSVQAGDSLAVVLETDRALGGKP